MQGLESIRLIGNHGINVQLMVFLAKNYASQVLKKLYNIRCIIIQLFTLQLIKIFLLF